MVAIKAAGVDAFLARPDPSVFCVLVYGPDSGLVNERSSALARRSMSDPNDAFALIRLDGDDLASDPSRLLDEAHTIALFGGRRTIWVRAGTRQFQGAVEKLLAGPAPDAFIVIEAGDLRKGAPLRTICEKSPKAAAVPCFADNEAAIGRLVDRELADAGLTLDREARTALVGALGADRLATRQEIDKLVLFAHGAARVTLADVDAVIADASVLALDDAVDATFSGDVAGLERGLSRLEAAGTPATAVLVAALRHALQLHKVRIDIERGVPASQVLERGWPMLHFRRRGAVEASLSKWSLARLDDAIRRCADGVLEGRRGGAFGEVVAARTLLSLAENARRR